VSEPVEVGAVEAFADGQVTIVDIANRTIGVYRNGDEFFAMLNVCPHRGAPICQGTITGTMLPSPPGELVYGMDGYVLRCPWHGWEYDVRSGQSVCDVDKRRLRTFAVSTRNDHVYVEVGRDAS
jgi:nitrite reductase/ring-hydroxylating ferredoxin subunit